MLLRFAFATRKNRSARFIRSTVDDRLLPRHGPPWTGERADTMPCCGRSERKGHDIIATNRGVDLVRGLLLHASTEKRVKITLIGREKHMV